MFAFLNRIVGDNWDLEVKARCQTKSQTNKSLHYFHAYAVKDRVISKGLDNTRPQKSIDEVEMQEILPTAEVQESIISDLSKLIPRVIVAFLPPYKSFRKAIQYHLPHPHSQEMEGKSEVVSFPAINEPLVVCAVFLIVYLVTYTHEILYENVFKVQRRVYFYFNLLRLFVKLNQLLIYTIIFLCIY